MDCNELLQSAGLNSPFVPGCLDEVVAESQTYLNS